MWYAERSKLLNGRRMAPLMVSSVSRLSAVRRAAAA